MNLANTTGAPISGRYILRSDYGRYEGGDKCGYRNEFNACFDSLPMDFPLRCK